MKRNIFITFLLFLSLEAYTQKQFSVKPYSLELSAFYSLTSSGIGIGQNEIAQFLYSENMGNGHGAGLSLVYNYYFKHVVIAGGFDILHTTFSNSEIQQLTPHPQYGFILASVQREHTSLLYINPKIQIGLWQLIRGNKRKSKFLLHETLGIVFPINAHYSINYIDITNNEQTNNSKWFSGDENWMLGLGYNAGLHLSKSHRPDKKIKGYGIGLNFNYFPHLEESNYEMLAMACLSVLF